MNAHQSRYAEPNRQNDRKTTPLEKAMEQAEKEKAYANGHHRGSFGQGQGYELSVRELQERLVWNAEQALDFRITDYFRRMLDSAYRPQLMLAIPKFLLTDPFLGNDAVAAAVINTQPENVHLILELCERQDTFKDKPSSTVLIQFLTEKSEDKKYTAPELFWLFKLSEFLRCMTSEFSEKVMKQQLYENKEKLSATKVYMYFNPENAEKPVDEIGSIVQRQYDAIEAFLKRL